MDLSPPRSGNSTRNRRLRLACARCQKRKIRCDGAYPSCNNCKKASAICSDGDSLRLRAVADDDNEVAELRSKIASLEAAVEERDQRLANLQAQATTGPQNGPHFHAAHDNSLPTPGFSTASGVSETPAESHGSAIGHEIGLISVGSSSTPRYLGPSSGYFLSRILFDTTPASTQHGKLSKGGNQGPDGPPTGRSNMKSSLLKMAPPAAGLPDKARAIEFVDAFFETIAPQYPIIHRPSFLHNLDTLYSESIDANTEASDPMVHFHTYLVLAIGATVISQRFHIPLPAESYCVSAMKYFDSLSFECSLPGLQGLLLLLVFAMHNPRFKLNVWHLNYHCIALLLELGIQRNITGRPGMSLLEEQMRVRLFWVVFSLDRTIATIMGRPIGIRDEACELRYPDVISDESLSASTGASAMMSEYNSGDSTPPYMAYAVHLFKLSKLNSEIKYVANSIVRNTPHYAHPRVADLYEWQETVLSQLDEWFQSIPSPSRGGKFTSMETICQLRYHSLVVLLTRPSPAILHPTSNALRKCYRSCKASIHLYDRLYRDNNLVFSWTVFHGLLLSIITFLYCIRASSEVAQSIEADLMILDVCKGLNVLSAAGEYWPGAKRSRNILDDLLQDLARWLKQPRTQAGNYQVNADISGQDAIVSNSNVANGPTDGTIQGYLDFPSSVNVPIDSQENENVMSGTDDLFANPFMGSWDFVNPEKLDSLMHNFFTEFPGSPSGML